MGKPLDRVPRINCKHSSHERSSPCLTNLSFGRSKVNEQAFNISQDGNYPFLLYVGAALATKVAPIAKI